MKLKPCFMAFLLLGAKIPDGSVLNQPTLVRLQCFFNGSLKLRITIVNELKISISLSRPS